MGFKNLPFGFKFSFTRSYLYKHLVDNTNFQAFQNVQRMGFKDSFWGHRVGCSPLSFFFLKKKILFG